MTFDDAKVILNEFDGKSFLGQTDQEDFDIMAEQWESRKNDPKFQQQVIDFATDINNRYGETKPSTEVSTEVEPEPIVNKFWDRAEELRKSGGNKPFIYTVVATKDIPSLGAKAGQMLDQIKVDINASPEEVLEEASKMSYWQDVKDSVKVEKSITENPVELAAITDGASLIAPYSTRAALNAQVSDDSQLTKTLKIGAATAGDVARMPLSLLASYVGAIGEPGDYLENVVKQYGYTEAPEMSVKVPVISDIAQNVLRDPMALASIPIGGEALALGKYVPGALAMKYTPAISKAIKPMATGAGAGVIDVAGKDIVEDYGAGMDRVGLGQYAAGAVGGALLPKAFEAASALKGKIKDVMTKVPETYSDIASKVKMSEPTSLSNINIKPQSPYAEALLKYDPLAIQGYRDIPVTYTGGQTFSMNMTAPLKDKVSFFSDLVSGKVKQPIPDAKQVAINARAEYNALPQPQTLSREEFITQRMKEVQAQQPTASITSTLLDIGQQKFAKALSSPISGVNKAIDLYQKFVYEPRMVGYQPGYKLSQYLTDPSKTPMQLMSIQQSPIARSVGNAILPTAAYKTPTEAVAAYDVAHDYLTPEEQLGVNPSIIQAQYERYLQEKARQQGGR